jgi:hypothetical protein
MMPMLPKYCSTSASLVFGGRPSMYTVSVSGSENDMVSALYAMVGR